MLKEYFLINISTFCVYINYQNTWTRLILRRHPQIFYTYGNLQPNSSSNNNDRLVEKKNLLTIHTCVTSIIYGQLLFTSKIVAVVGGMAPQKQQRLLRKCPEIIVATPGRLWDLISEVQTKYFMLDAQMLLKMVIY